MSTSLYVAQSIQSQIDRFCNAPTVLTSPANKGDTTLKVQRALDYRIGDTLALSYDDKMEFGRVMAWCEGDQTYQPLIDLSEPLENDFPACETEIRKTYKRRFLKDILLGNPDSLADTPAITIEVVDVEREPTTIEDVTDTYRSLIGIWVDAQTYKDAYELLLLLTDSVSYALHRELYPPIFPLYCTKLAEPAGALDHVIKVEETSGAVLTSEGGLNLAGAWVWLESATAGYKRYNKVTEVLQNGALALRYVAGRDYAKGDFVKVSLSRAYDPRVTRVEHDTADNDTLWHSSTIEYTVKVLVNRRKNELV